MTQSPRWQKLVLPIDLGFVEKPPSSVVVKPGDPVGTDVLVRRLLAARAGPFCWPAVFSPNSHSD